MKLSILTVTKNRPAQLIDKAANSLLNQTSREFEWIVVSDGKNSATESEIANFKVNANFLISYRTIESSKNEFGLCVGRNLALTIARGLYATYLDDDNSLSPDFVRSTLEFVDSHPNIYYFIPRAYRARGIWQHNKFTQSSSFVSPKPNTTVEELVTHQQLFDSNGFTHRRESAPLWNGQYRIYCDYEYFISCLQTWGVERFSLNPQILVNYCQSNLGVIGSSNYQDWARELNSMLTCSKYPLLKNNQLYQEQLKHLAYKYDALAQKQKSIPAFNQ